MGKKSPPPAPDYTAAAVAQGQSSAQNTAAQTWANRPTINTPWGSQTWQTGSQIDPSTGKPMTSWTSNISLSPDQQSALDSQMRVQEGRSQGAETLLDQAVGNFQRPTDWSAFPSARAQINPRMIGNGPQMGQYGGPRQQVQPQVGDPANIRSRAEQNALDFQRPIAQQRRAAMETQLANQGIQRGSEAYGNAMRELGDQEGREGMQAFAAGRDEAGQMFQQELAGGQFANQAQQQQFGQGMQMTEQGNAARQRMFDNQRTASGENFSRDMASANFQNQGRQQAIAEDNMRRSQTLNELNALLTGQQVNSPQMPSFSQSGRADTTNFMGAAQNQYQAGLDAYNSQAGQFGGMMGGLFGLGSAALGSPTGWQGLFKF